MTARDVRRLLQRSACVLIALAFLLQSSCNFSVNVSGRNMISQTRPNSDGQPAPRLAHDPEARWFDLNQILRSSDLNAQVENLKQVFSTEFLLRESGVGVPNFPKELNPETSDEQLAQLESLAIVYEATIDGYLRDLALFLRKFLEDHDVVVGNTTFDKKRMYHDPNGYPQDGCVSHLQLKSWAGKIGEGEAEEFSLKLRIEKLQWQVLEVQPDVLGFRR